jgi:hypothetical protein
VGSICDADDIPDNDPDKHRCADDNDDDNDRGTDNDDDNNLNDDIDDNDRGTNNDDSKETDLRRGWPVSGR